MPKWMKLLVACLFCLGIITVAAVWLRRLFGWE